MVSNLTRLRLSSRTVECKFIGSFKVGDNIAYNFEILDCLLGSQSNPLLNKPILLQAVSISEAFLQQIIYRTQFYSLEGIPPISAATRVDIESKKIDKFSVIIDVMQKHNILDGAMADIYDRLHMVRKLRNKIHIQTNLKNVTAEVDENRIFTDVITRNSLALVCDVFDFLNDTYPRPAYCVGYIKNFKVPYRV